MKSLTDVLEAGADDDSVASSGIDGSLSSAEGFKDGESSSFQTSTKKETSNTSESSTLARSETRAVNRSKLMVLAVLAVAAMGVGFATFSFTRASETNQFESKVRDIILLGVWMDGWILSQSQRTNSYYSLPLYNHSLPTSTCTFSSSTTLPLKWKSWSTTRPVMSF